MHTITSSFHGKRLVREGIKEQIVCKRKSTLLARTTFRKMSWRALKPSGTNDIPLGGTRKFGAAPVEDAAPPQLAAPSPHDFSRSRFQDSDPRERGRSQDDQRSSAPGTCLFCFR
jgi:hypothetical protein